eukprot:364487-Chlamydomonas_euryale.AAC.14
MRAQIEPSPTTGIQHMIPPLFHGSAARVALQSRQQELLKALPEPQLPPPPRDASPPKVRRGGARVPVSRRGGHGKMRARGASHTCREKGRCASVLNLRRRRRRCVTWLSGMTTPPRPSSGTRAVSVRVSGRPPISCRQDGVGAMRGGKGCCDVARGQDPAPHDVTVLMVTYADATCQQPCTAALSHAVFFSRVQP